MRNKQSLTFLALASTLLEGCSRSPSISVLGSYFPAWIVCCLVGILMATLTYLLFVRIDFDPAIPMKVLTYPGLAVLYTFLTWILFYS